MSETVVVLTEEPLNEADVQNLQLLAGDETTFSVLIPEDTRRNLVLDFLDRLSMLEVARAFRELLHGQPKPEEARLAADEARRISAEALVRAGLPGSVEVVGDDGVTALVDYVKNHEVTRAVVITTPHAIEDTFHRDWANRAQEKLGIPVLHLYSGTGYIGDS
ncbi:hypothetical protein [Arthrobacter mobilis]|jgi:hypothetical protein|uniref:Uncharacterized protein n=1 Tax=Arthrobacter mobilis TaxID=2724944 RepID=A0A7X6HF49_9MICC|nr:hypothetical protein [Arthrobacter mobilis]NKX54846.1 hypothetical protein [Arthrobacter mobilis]